MSAHEDLSREADVKGSSDRSFGVVFSAVFAAVGLWPLLGAAAVRWWALVLAAALLAAAVAAPALLAPANRLWRRFGLILHRIVNPVITGLIFYLAVTPTGLMLRVLGMDPLRLRIDREAKSNWIERRPPGPGPETMPNQF